VFRRCFVTGDDLLRRCFVTETFCMETFCRGDVLCGDVLYVRRILIVLEAVLQIRQSGFWSCPAV
jgi:hypothetical protein